MPQKGGEKNAMIEVENSKPAAGNTDNETPTTEELLARVLPISSSGAGSYVSHRRPMGSESVTPASIKQSLEDARKEEEKAKNKK